MYCFIDRKCLIYISMDIKIKLHIFDLVYNLRKVIVVTFK